MLTTDQNRWGDFMLPQATSGSSSSDPFKGLDWADKDFNTTLFHEYARPILDQQLQSMQAFLPYQQQMRAWLGQLMGMPASTGGTRPGPKVEHSNMSDFLKAVTSKGGTTGDMSGLPDWLRPQDTSIGGITGELGIPDAPDWTKPFTPEQIATYMDTGMTDLQSSMNDIRGNINSDLARRGLRGLGTTSSADTSMMAGLDAFNRFQQAQLKSGLLDKTIGRGDQLRGEATNRGTLLAGLQQNRLGNNQQNFWNMFNASNPQYQGGQANQYFAQNPQKQGGGSGDIWNMIGQLGAAYFTSQTGVPVPYPG